MAITSADVSLGLKKACLSFTEGLVIDEATLARSDSAKDNPLARFTDEEGKGGPAFNAIIDLLAEDDSNELVEGLMDGVKSS